MQKRRNRTCGDQFVAREIVGPSVAYDASLCRVLFVLRFAQRQGPDFAKQSSFFIGSDEFEFIHHAPWQVLRNSKQLALFHLVNVSLIPVPDDDGAAGTPTTDISAARGRHRNIEQTVRPDR